MFFPRLPNFGQEKCKFHNYYQETATLRVAVSLELCTLVSE